jgi:hypothetical protein
MGGAAGSWRRRDITAMAPRDIGTAARTITAAPITTAARTITAAVGMAVHGTERVGTAAVGMAVVGTEGAVTGMEREVTGTGAVIGGDHPLA